MEWFIARRYLRGKRRLQSISLIAYVSTGGVFLGCLVLVIALSIANGFEKEVRDRIVGMFAHARIQQYYGRTIENPDSIRQIVLRNPGVLAASPFLSSKGTIEHQGVQEGVMIMGIDDSLEQQVTDLGRMIVFGTLELDTLESDQGRRGAGIILGSGLADKLGARPGAEVIVSTVAATEEGAEVDPLSRIRAARYVVSGVFESGMYEYDGSLIYIGVESAQRLFSVKGVEGIQFRTRDLFSADRVAEQVRSSLGGYPYRAVDWKNQNRSLFKWMKLERLIIFIVVSLIMVVAAFNIVSSLIMMILEKRREIGILMGMGATSQAIMKIFMFNGVVVGFIGSSLGVGLGALLCWVQVRWALIPLPGDIYFIDKLPVMIRPLDMVEVFITANVICFLATLYPSWQASRILPAESLRME